MENAVRAPMDNDSCVILQVPLGQLKRIHLDILSENDAKILSATVIQNVNDVCGPALGLPTLNGGDCLTCGAKSKKASANTSRDCEGHFGLIDLPSTVLNPYYMSEVATVLNKICPGCKSFRHTKKSDPESSHNQRSNCRYCTGNNKNGYYPKTKFKVSSKDVFGKTAIIAEVDEKLLNKKSHKVLAPDYWDVFLRDSTPEDSGSQPNKRVLLPSQVYLMLKDVCPSTLEDIVRRKNSIFLNNLLVTPNSHRVTEFGGRMIQDEATRMYRRLVDFRGSPNELSARVLDRYKVLKIRSEKVSSTQQAYERQSSNDSLSSSSGLKNIKELLIGKRTDHCFRLVVVGDTRIKVDEIGLPLQVAENVLVSDQIQLWNWSKLGPCCEFMLKRKSKFVVSRDGQNININSMEMLRVGDTIQRPLMDGDILFINRPPSIHQHSLIGLSVKVLPIHSVVSINPLVCPPLRGDFDGDCLHGFVPQSASARVEIKELVSLDKQLVDGQSGENLLSFSQDSLTAAHLLVQDGVLLSRPGIQQLQMFGSHRLTEPAIIQSTSGEDTFFWTGKQLFSHFLPPDFEFSHGPNGVSIRHGELLSSSRASSWLRDSDGNLFQGLLSQFPDKFLDFLHGAQEMLCEWLCERGLSVSLSDLRLSSDPESRKNLMDDLYFGLQEAERLSDISCLLVNGNQSFLIECSEHDENMLNVLKERIYAAQQTSAALCHVSLSASVSVFRAMQNLVYQYASSENSFMAMLKAGSKGNLQKLFQHSICLGLQHSVTPLSFSIPRRLSCDSWNDQKKHVSFYKSDGTRETTESYIPCTVIENSYLDGLNPLECFVHSLTTRDSSFSGQADISGTLTRNMMFFMRDLTIGYDGTIRNCYGNQIVQFYSDEENISGADMAGHTVGALAACAIGETAYSALDQPVSVLEPSPLLALKKALDCGAKKNKGIKSASLFLSEGLGRGLNKYEYGALEIKGYLESLLFSSIVSEVMISHCISSNRKNVSPWACHFHINKELAMEKRLKPESIIKALDMNCKVSAQKMKLNLPDLVIENKLCSETDMQKRSDYIICISVARTLDKSSDMDIREDSPELLSEVVIPVLLQTVIKGYPEFKKVDILWKDEGTSSKFPERRSGELYLRIVSSDYCNGKNFWSILMEKCLGIRDMIDWKRSHPDDIHDYTEFCGIAAAWQRFVNRLHSAITATGKTMLAKHLVLTANCLSWSGAFVSLNAKGLAAQRKDAKSYSPFMQACYSKPADVLLKAAKVGITDHLQGSVDALAWGQAPPIGTGCQFEVILNQKGQKPGEPRDSYSLAIKSVQLEKEPKLLPKLNSGKPLGQWQYWEAGKHSKHLPPSVREIHGLSRAVQLMLQKHPINNLLCGEDKSNAMKVFQYHPRREEKIGHGNVEIKIGLHPEHKDSRCFIVVREDGTEEDISFRKCICNALEKINAEAAKRYHSRWLSRRDTENGTTDELHKLD